MNIYVGNLPFKLSQEELQEVFAPYGSIDRVHLVTDRETGRARGFGFVEMPNNEEASKAIEGLNGHELSGRSITVNEARPRAPR